MAKHKSHIKDILFERCKRLKNNFIFYSGCCWRPANNNKILHHCSKQTFIKDFLFIHSSFLDKIILTAVMYLLLVSEKIIDGDANSSMENKDCFAKLGCYIVIAK